MTSRWAIQVGIVLVVLLTGGTARSAGSPAAGPPLEPGSVWVYRYTVVPASGPSQTGTLKRTYVGPTTYRGRDVYYTEQTNTVLPGLLQRDYYVRVDGHLREIGQEFRNAQNSAVEILFDKSLPTDVPGSVSGQATVYQSGGNHADVAWSVVLANRGPVKVTVPAGTFQATKWETRFRLGKLESVETSDSVGLVDVRVESRQTTAGGGRISVHRELVSGPVPAR